jgi:hypothetical protein
MPDRLRLHDFSKGSLAAVPDALVVMLFAAGDGRGQALGLARSWQPIVPRAAFVGIEIDDPVRAADLETFRLVPTGAPRVRAVERSQIILLGSGGAGRLALDWVLRGDVAPAGVIGIDIALDLAPRRIVRTATMVRLVQHPSADDPRAARVQALTEAIRREEIDVRCMVLPNGAQASPDVTTRAGGAFLAELVANASRIPPRTGNWL